MQWATPLIVLHADTDKSSHMLSCCTIFMNQTNAFTTIQHHQYFYDAYMLLEYWTGFSWIKYDKHVWQPMFCLYRHVQCLAFLQSKYIVS